MSNPVLNLNTIVDVVVNVSPVAVANETFNQGLVIGSSVVIPNATRLVSFQSPSGLLSYGFNSSSPEYLASLAYFDQNPAPLVLWVGLQDTTAIQTATLNTGGTGYAVGDLITVVQSGGSGGVFQVTAVSSGVVTTFSQVTQGTGYSVANTLATTTNKSGTGCKLNITVIGETCLQAINACRSASNAWYQVVALNAVTADHEAIAPVAQAMMPYIQYMFTTSDSAVLANTAGNVGYTLQAANYSRTWGIYSTQSVYAAVMAMGVACGNNTGLANSAFVMMFMKLVGLAPEPLTSNQVANISGIPGSTFGMGLNVYVQYNSEFSILQQGAMSNGYFMDQVLYRDMLSNAIQTQVMNLLCDSPKVPLTDQGVTQIIHTINQQCDNFVNIGYIAPGVWGLAQVLNLSYGESMPKGYVVQAPSCNTLTTSQRANRTSPPVYVCLNEASGIQNIIIGVYPQA